MAAALAVIVLPSRTTDRLGTESSFDAIARLKQLANRRDMPYQSLLKMFLTECLDEEVAEQSRR